MTQEHESTWSHLRFRAQDCWIFLRHSFLSQSAPVGSFWPGDFAHHQPLTEARAQPADCQHHRLSPPRPAHTALARQLAFPEKPNRKQMREQNLRWFPWGGGWWHSCSAVLGNLCQIGPPGCQLRSFRDENHPIPPISLGITFFKKPLSLGLLQVLTFDFVTTSLPEVCVFLRLTPLILPLFLK